MEIAKPPATGMLPRKEESLAPARVAADRGSHVLLLLHGRASTPVGESAAEQWVQRPPRKREGDWLGHVGCAVHVPQHFDKIGLDLGIGLQFRTVGGVGSQRSKNDLASMEGVSMLVAKGRRRRWRGLPGEEVGKVEGLPHRVVSAVVRIGVHRELGIIPELGRELGEDLGVRGHVEIGDGFSLPVRERRLEFDIVMLKHAETDAVRTRWRDRMGIRELTRRCRARTRRGWCILPLWLLLRPLNRMR